MYVYCNIVYAYNINKCTAGYIYTYIYTNIEISTLMYLRYDVYTSIVSTSDQVILAPRWILFGTRLPRKHEKRAPRKP